MLHHYITRDWARSTVSIEVGPLADKGDDRPLQAHTHHVLTGAPYAIVTSALDICSGVCSTRGAALP